MVQGQGGGWDGVVWARMSSSIKLTVHDTLANIIMDSMDYAFFTTQKPSECLMAQGQGRGTFWDRMSSFK